MRGVMRVGLVAKGLLLKGDMDLELVLLCTEKPTVTLLKKVAENLSTQIEVVYLFHLTSTQPGSPIVLRRPLSQWRPISFDDFNVVSLWSF